VPAIFTWPRNLDIANATIAVSAEESMQSKSCDLLLGTNNQITIMWNDIYQASNELFIAYYNPTLDIWSKKRQLTEDNCNPVINFPFSKIRYLPDCIDTASYA